MLLFSPQYCFDEPVFGFVPILPCLFSFLTVTEECRALSQLLLMINFIVVLLIASCCFNSLQIK